jgi:hypothetical protein
LSGALIASSALVSPRPKMALGTCFPTVRARPVGPPPPPPPPQRSSALGLLLPHGAVADLEEGEARWPCCCCVCGGGGDPTHRMAGPLGPTC